MRAVSRGKSLGTPTRALARAGWFAAVVAVGAAPVLGQEPPAQLPSVHEPSVQITFLDVGQGDAVVIRSPDGQSALIDAGSSGTLRYLQQMNVDEIDLLVATHPHADHIGGVVDVLTARPVRFFMDNGQPHTTATYRRLMATLELLSEVTYLEAVPRTISLGGVSLEVLPLPALDVDHNNRSVGLVLRYGAFSVFLSGDSERRELTHFVQSGVVPDVTVLKAAHHGSENGFTWDFLRAASPEVVVISVGADNAYQHPRPEALTAYGAFAEHLLRTDRDGHVTVLGYADGSYEIVLGGETVVSATGDAGPETVTVADGGTSPTPTSMPTEDLSITVFADAPGNDHEHLNGEHVTISNHREAVVDISRWRICDLSSRCFRFPDGARIEADARVVVYTGYGVSDGVTFFMNNGRAVWNNNGDEATLYDANGVLVSRHVYE